MKRRLILHLGIAKTGTTTIQTFLRENPDLLEKAGIVYPKLGFDLTSLPRFQGSMAPRNLGDELNHLALALEIQKPRTIPPERIDTPLWSLALDRFDESGAHTAVISYEGFAMNVESFRFDALAPRLRDYDVLGLVYLRRLEDWTISLYGQLVRGKDRLATPFADFPTFLHATRIGFSKRLDDIRARIALDELVVADFESAAGPGLVADFMAKARLPSEQISTAPEARTVNVSLPHWATLFILRCNQRGLPDNAFLDVRWALTQFARTGKPIDGLRPGLDIATPDQRQALRDAVDNDAEPLREQYGLTLSTRARDSIAYRDFNDEDFQAIRTALTPRLAEPARDALERI